MTNEDRSLYLIFVARFIISRLGMGCKKAIILKAAQTAR